MRWAFKEQTNYRKSQALYTTLWAKRAEKDSVPQAFQKPLGSCFTNKNPIKIAATESHQASHLPFRPLSVIMLTSVSLEA